MIDFLYGFSNISLLFFLFFISVLFSLFMHVILKRIPLFKFKNNELASLSAVAQTVGIVYALLSGFTIAYVMNNFDKADSVVGDEATVITNIYRDAQLLPSATGEIIQAQAKEYTKAVLQEEWPSLIQGEINSTSTDSIINQLTHTTYVLQANSTSPREGEVEAELLKKCDTLYSIHQERLSLASSALNIDIWSVLIITTFIIIIINLLFPMGHGLSLISIVSVSFIVATLLFLILALDRPFRGEYSVKPTAFETALSRMRP